MFRPHDRLGKRSAARSPEPTKRRRLPQHGDRRDSLLPRWTASEGGNNEWRKSTPRDYGFRRLESLAMDDGLTIMKKLSDESTLALFGQLTCKEEMKEDWMRHVVTVLSKVCQVEYKPILLRLIQRICQKQFIDQLLLHITRLPDDNDIHRKENLCAFFDQLCTFCEALLKLMPTLACGNLGIILKAASREIEALPPFSGSEDITKKLSALMVKFKTETERLESLKTAPKLENGFSTKPPSDFRELTHFPTLEDIVVDNHMKPFLRPNKVDPKVHGTYENVDDYLDVQFRLMREDFVRPLREGVSRFRESRDARQNCNNKRPSRIQNIRVYENVRMLHVERDNSGNVGIVLDFDPQKRYASNIKWEYSKRLMIGSLLVLSEDEQFSKIVLVTVTKRDIRELQGGRVMVELCEESLSDGLFRRQYLMIECQVFFGTYCHVLKALKNFNESSFPFVDYIVHASNVKQLPDYLVRASEANKGFQLFPDNQLRPLNSHKHKRFDRLHVDLYDDHLYSYSPHSPPYSPQDSLSDDSSSDDSTMSAENVSVDVKNLETCSSARELGLDDSQYQAFCGALTNKIMLIQGPPGTGKTFIGLKIAAALLQNQQLWRPSEDPRPMLVVCYTNHALDQFLKGLKTYEKSIVRVGGGCKEPSLMQNSINVLRQSKRPFLHNMRQQKSKLHRLKDLGHSIRTCASRLKEGAAGIVSVETFQSHSILTDVRLTDKDMILWLCGFGEYGRIDGPFPESLVHNEYQDDPAFWPLEVPTEDLPKVILSCSFRLWEHYLTGRDQAHQMKMEKLLGRLKQQISASQYPRYPEHLVRQPHPSQFWRLPYNDRWRLYRHWRDSLVAALDVKFRPVLARIEAALSATANELSSWRMVEDQLIMAQYAVVGMTTSFAASRQQILKELKPRIVIVEEAAEVFESHVLVSLAGDVEHLIMIGDHQQLRPNPAVHELGVKYHLDVSLFERLINNGMHYVTLSTQHRMRPELAKLISPAIYPDLKNHPSVAEFPAVRGVAKNVFFVDHTHPEEVVKDAQSFQNSHEANFLSSLVQYLLHQGYSPAQITVLSAYKGQQYFFSRLKKHHSHLQDVRMTVVDNFQGEESDIILLSLVRSNAENAVGFLKTENRVCVALSRAKHGLYIVGNMSNLTAADTVWRRVEEELRGQGAIGPALQLHCDRHDVATPVSTAGDFSFCPQGGCSELCQSLMPCGHHCKQVCHTQDLAHRTVMCKERCVRPACALQHPCPERCSVQPCPPCLVPKEEKLPCNHSARMPCHVDPATHKCKVLLPSTLLPCGHHIDVRCHQLAHLAEVPCASECAVRMPCGHACRRKCHAFKDPNHENVKCRQTCEEKRHGCTSSPPHLCSKFCFEECEDCTVQVDKTLSCGHLHKAKCNVDAATLKCMRDCEKTPACGHKCSKKCHEPCDPCEEKVLKTVPRCGHEQKVSCGRSPDPSTCRMPCERLLPCGHKCGILCGQDCSTGQCSHPVPYPKTPTCGHPISVPCHRQNEYEPNSPDLLALCTHPCSTLLKPCDHQCGGSCGACLQGRVHQPCKSKCERRLLCGHLCREDCPKSCPPCTLPCQQRCAHSYCNRRCGEPCVRCKEPCTRRCQHGRCLKPCGDQCSFECSKPCLKKLKKCGHDCIGLCGDPCICKECNEEEVTTIFLGSEEDDGARFIRLPDCKHILESIELDKWMSIETWENWEDDIPSEIKPKVCPRCTTPVTKCQRYSNVTKKVAEDITAVKAKFYDTKMIQSHLDRVKGLLQNMPKFPAEYQTSSRLVSQVDRTRNSMEDKMPSGRHSDRRRVPPLNTSEAKTLEQKVLILKGINQIVVTASRASNINLAGRREMQQVVEQLCGNLSQRQLLRLSEQEASDINLELTRLQRLVQLLQVESGCSFGQLQESDRSTHEEVSKILRGLTPYPEEDDRRILLQLEELAAAACVGLSRPELDAIVAAMGMKPGHWFRCPNGHPYCITECGGAMEEAACPVEGCGAHIGGASHRLRRDNTLASDVDGASGPAWHSAMQY
ncbi:NFX1-type zinc finger-containing protein 1-like [Thrips palmi]|uniref:NFX1-type zinc finger-containing protein 1-like n=1 Tax=Thrips palmi TaxID=161013 RepID=A0A6P8YH11_THRPL|nr:NFX1-type zinc finger-containing protein 1-like [Thrips palmi]